MAPANMFFNDPSLVRLGANSIASIGDYHPWGKHLQSGGDGANYPAHSKRILDIKDDHDHAVEHFFKILDPIIAPKTIIVVVPSHDPAKTTSALASSCPTASEVERQNRRDTLPCASHQNCQAG